MVILRYLARNFGTLLLAFVLAFVVWVTAVVSADPDREGVYRPVEIEIIGKEPDLMLRTEVPETARLTLRAPQSVWTELNNQPNLVDVWIDLSGLGSGTHTVPVKYRIQTGPVRVLAVTPDTVTVTLEQIVSREFDVELIINDEPAEGYRAGSPVINPNVVSVSGPASAMEQVDRLQAILNIAGASETIRNIIPIQPLDENGNLVPDVTVTPKVVTVNLPITLLRGFKTVAVRVITSGSVADGYRITNVQPTPPTVTISSPNPELLNEIPGFIETQPLDLTGLSDDRELRVELDLPQGVSLVGEQSILVQVSVASIETSIRIPLPVEPTGLSQGLAAAISPSTVDVIISGPIPILDNLTPASFRVQIDLTGLEEGTHQVAPELDLVPNEVTVESVLPEVVEVIIQPAPTPTPAVTVTATP